MFTLPDIDRVGAVVSIGERLVIASYQRSAVPVSGVRQDFLLARTLLLSNQRNQSSQVRI